MIYYTNVVKPFVIVDQIMHIKVNDIIHTKNIIYTILDISCFRSITHFNYESFTEFKISFENNVE